MLGLDTNGDVLKFALKQIKLPLEVSGHDILVLIIHVPKDEK